MADNVAQSSNNNAQPKQEKPKQDKPKQDKQKQDKPKQDKKPSGTKIDLNALPKPEFIEHRLKVLEEYLKVNPPAKKGT